MLARQARAVVVACAVAAVALVPIPAGAAVTRAEVTAVRDASGCGPSACGSEAARIERGGAASGPIEIAVAVEAQLPVDWVELEARFATETVCLQRWALGDRLSFSGVFRWDTPVWPNRPVNSDCLEESSHKHGVPTANGVIDLALLVQERGASAPVSSGTYAIDLANAPSAPEWLADPAVSGGVVKLRWKPPPQTDVSEYVIERAGPSDGKRAVGAADPTAAGCKTLPSIGIECEEGPFTGAGEYTFTVRARRPGSGGVRCETTPGRCLSSAPMPAKSIDYAPAGVEAPGVEVLPPVAEPTPDDASSSPVAIATATPTTSSPFAPSQHAVGQNAPTPRTVPARPALIAVASAMAFLIGIAHRRLIPQKPDREQGR